jgi:predicted nucleic acid-binding protein
MRRGAIFDSSFWVHAVYLDLVSFLLTDYELLCPRAVANELGRDNPTSLRLKTLLTAKTIQLATPRAEKITLYGDGERAAINLALERKLLLLIDDWRPYEAARAAGVDVANTPAYLVQLYNQNQISIERVLSDLGRLVRRGTLRPEWLHAALKLVSEMRKKGKDP